MNPEEMILLYYVANVQEISWPTEHLISLLLCRGRIHAYTLIYSMKLFFLHLTLINLVRLFLDERTAKKRTGV